MEMTTPIRTINMKLLASILLALVAFAVVAQVTYHQTDGFKVTNDLNLNANYITNAAGISIGAEPGIAATIDVIVAGDSTNRLVFVGGILVSNITEYYPE